MATVSRTISAAPDRVWSVLADGWNYPLFVVGASRMRDVDVAWPEVGTKLHHSVGVWPALIDDATEVLEMLPGARLRLRAKGWPLGEAEVEFRLTEHPDGTRIEIEEVPTSGPGVLVPPPFKGLGLQWRNTETLRRIALIAENRAPAHTGEGP